MTLRPLAAHAFSVGRGVATAYGFRRIATGKMGTFFYDPAKDRYEWDDNAVELLGGTVGPESTYADVLSHIRPPARKDYDRWRMEAVTSGSVGSARIPYSLPDKEIVLQVTYENVDGKTTGFLLDVTQDEALLEGIQTRQVVMEFAERLVRFGTWAYDIRTGSFTASKGATDLLLPGVEPRQLTIEKVLELVAEPDRKKIRSAYDEAAASGHPREVEFQLASGEGWRMIQFMRLLGDDGEPAYTCGFIHDTTNLHDGQLDKAEVERLRAADEIRGRLVHAAAHELNQPLTPMRLELAMLADRMPDDVVTMRGFRTIERSVDRLQFMMNDLLDAARSQAGRLSIEPATFDPLPHVEQVVHTLRPLAQERNVDLQWEPDQVPKIWADAMRLEQCVSNIVHNAIKFTAQGSHVVVEASAGPSRVCISVRDDGPGLAEEQQKLLFQPFQQIYPSPRGFVSTGLGLFITRSLMDAMGGEVDVESQSGKGSTFNLRFPTDVAG